MSRRGRDQEDPAPTPADQTESRHSPHYTNHRQRLRARFLASEPERIPDYELLEMLLFYSIDRVDVKPLAKQLLADFRGLSGVLSADQALLSRYPRVSERTVAHFRAIREVMRRLLRQELSERPVISSSTQLIDYCRLSMADERTERFRILFLNRKNMLIADEVQQRGTVDHTPVYPREVIKRALELGATALIMVHNHPSGDPAPSRADIEMTHEVRDAAEKLGISLYDHVIVGQGSTNSFKSMGLI